MQNRKIKIQMFMKDRQATHFMHCCGLDDNGMKIYGNFIKGEIYFNKDTKNLRQSTLAKRAIRAALFRPSCYFVQAGQFYAFKKDVTKLEETYARYNKIKIFSTGDKFIFVRDMEEQLKEHGALRLS